VVKLVINHEANKPLTVKRIFETKLAGHPLCVTLDDIENNIQLLMNAGIFINEREGYVTYEFTIGYPMYVTYHPGQSNLVDHLRTGQKYTVPS